MGCSEREVIPRVVACSLEKGQCSYHFFTSNIHPMKLKSNLIAIIH
jgi:hypothetical protein